MLIKGLDNLPCKLRLFTLEKGHGGYSHNFPGHEGQLLGTQKLSLHKEPHGEDKGQ